MPSPRSSLATLKRVDVLTLQRADVNMEKGEKRVADPTATERPRKRARVEDARETESPTQAATDHQPPAADAVRAIDANNTKVPSGPFTFNRPITRETTEGSEHPSHNRQGHVEVEFLGPCSLIYNGPASGLHELLKMCHGSADER